MYIVSFIGSWPLEFPTGRGKDEEGAGGNEEEGGWESAQGISPLESRTRRGCVMPDSWRRLIFFFCYYQARDTGFQVCGQLKFCCLIEDWWSDSGISFVVFWFARPEMQFFCCWLFIYITRPVIQNFRSIVWSVVSWACFVLYRISGLSMS